MSSKPQIAATLTLWIVFLTAVTPAWARQPTVTAAQPTVTAAQPTVTVAQSTALQAIDQQYARGMIDARTRHIYRVATIKQPHRLPSEIRKLTTVRATTGPSTTGPATAGPATVPWQSGTHIARSAWRWVRQNDAWHGELHRLLQPPPDKEYLLDSDVLPLRVSYAEPSHSAIAAVVLEAAEHSWFTEVDDYGFLPPPIEPGTERYRMYVEGAGPTAAGYLMPYESNPATSWSDCFSYIVIDPTGGDLTGVVAHEMSHATQAAMDCEEISTFWENTSTYIMSQVYASAWSYTLFTMAYFQAVPWRPLDFMLPSAAPYYEYGGALLLLYLTDTYAAPGEGGAMVADIWTAAMQEDDFEFNEPDYFDAIAEVVSTRGGASDFDDIFVDFSEARYFVGNRDDGQHITDAYTYEGAEVTLGARHWASSLPVQNGYVDHAAWPEEYGVAYVLLDLGEDYPYGLKIGFDGSDRTRWRVRLVRYGGGSDTTHTDLEITPETQEGELILPASDHPKMLLMAASLGPPGWDPDSSSAQSYLFLYDIEPVLPPLSVTGLGPSPLKRGQMAIPMELHGEGMVDGADFKVRFDDPGLRVGTINAVTPTLVTFELSVAVDTTLGPHNVTVTNRDGLEATGIGLLTVTEKDARPEPESNTSDGCGCQTSAASNTGLAMVWALFWLLIVRRRKV